MAREAGADGVHVGQDDMPVAEVRELVGADMLIGLSTHTPGGDRRGRRGASVDYIGVGPVHETPTKPGRPAVGLELVRYAAAHAPVPFFAIGGLDAGNLGEVLDAGASAGVRAARDRRAAEPERGGARAARRSSTRTAAAQAERGRRREPLEQPRRAGARRAQPARRRTSARRRC